MDETKVEIKIIRENLDETKDTELIKNALYKDCWEQNIATKIILTGKYQKEYVVVTNYEELNYNRVLVDNNFLMLCFWYDFVVVDLVTDKIVKQTDFNTYQLFEIHKFKNGYFIYGEMDNFYLDKNFEVLWEASCGDIFVNPKRKGEREMEILNDYIAVFDWFGIKHYYNEYGEFKSEYFPELDMNLND